MKKFKKILSCAAAATLAVTGIVGGASLGASANTTLITNGGPYAEDGFFIESYNKQIYFQDYAFELSFVYNTVGTPETDEEGNLNIDFNDTFEFLVFDTNWGGWDKTTVGPTGYDQTSDVTPVAGTTYTVEVPISVIESKLSTGGTPYGINIQTGLIGTSSVSIVSLELVSGSTPYVQEPFTITGNYVMGTASEMKVDPAGAATVNASEWNIEVSAINLSAWYNPTVDVTVTYPEASSDTDADGNINRSQAEIKISTGAIDPETDQEIFSTPDPNYVSHDAGTYTYTTEIPNTTTKFIAAYQDCTVTKIYVYDNNAGLEENPVTEKDAATISQNMGLAWNLGNALEIVDANGNVNEKAAGNAKATKKLIQAVKSAGFNTIRIPVTFLNLIGQDGTINDVYMARIQQVVNYAYDMGMYSIVSLHGDSMPGIKGYWIDIDKTGTEFNDILNKYSALWADIAQAFAGYDQKVIFQSADELMNSASNYAVPPTQTEYDNINALNQAFVNAVRNAGGANNTDRVLVVVGYNTNIDYTIAGFKKPTDSATNRLMLSVNYYDPSNFTIAGYEGGSDSSTTWDENGVYGKSYMNSQFERITNFAGANMPVIICEYGPAFKNNINQIANYCYWLNYYAALYGIVTAYWDNGVTCELGTALFNRSTNTITTNGQVIVDAIKAGYNLQPYLT